MTARADTAAAGLAELLVGDAVGGTQALAKQVGLKPRDDVLARVFQELAALRLACAELVFEREGAQFQRLAAPALVRRELSSELAKPARLGTARRRYAKATTADRLVGLVDAHKRDYAGLSTEEAIADHQVRRLMDLTGQGMSRGWMQVRIAELHAVQMSTATAANLVENGWFDAD